MASQRRVPLAIFNPIRFDARVRLSLFLLTAALAAALPAPDLLAQSKQGLWKPPIAVSSNISVWRGDRIKVTLRGFQGNNPVEYAIARAPSHGSLSEIVQPDPDRVTDSTDGFVVYTHDNSDESVTDEFTFRARGVRGGGVSAPAKVRINVMDRPPVLAAPAVLDFRAAAGESMTRSLGLTNTGGGILQIDCRTKPPFETIGAHSIELPRGTSTNVLVRYAPKVAGEELREAIVPGINDSTGAQVVLRGASLAPFDIAAASGQFLLEGKARMANLTLVSRATETQEVTVTAKPRGLVDVPSTVQLAPGASLPLEVRIPPERKGERQEVVLAIITPFHRREIAIAAPPVPASLELLTKDLNFTEGRRKAVISVTNSGGVAGVFRLSPVPGLTFAAGGNLDAREFTVAPDSKTDVELIFDAPRNAAPPSELPVELGGETELIPVLAPPPVPEPSPTARPKISPTPTPAAPPKPWKLNKDVRVSAQIAPILLLEWRPSIDLWREPELEVFRDSNWRPYERPADSRGIMQIIGDYLSGFFISIVGTRDVASTGEEPPPEAEWMAVHVDDDSAGNRALLWRLTAQKGKTGQREPASQNFVINWDAKNLEKAEEPAEATVPLTPTAIVPSPPANPAATTESRTIAPALKVEDARANPRRDSATVQVIFPRDPEADGYRLEHGFNPTLLDKNTGLPYPGDFRTVPHPTAKATVVGMANTEYEGRELTVLAATIEGLNAGTSTTWRVVTMADGKDRWPTGEFIVTTLPPWRFPWRQAMLIAAFAALAAVLYLRWRINRAPR
jgi:hypothetical protein